MPKMTGEGQFQQLAKCAGLDRLPSVVGEMHLAGHTAIDGCLIDTHGTCVCPEVWALFEEACRRLGPRPTLIEWDTDLPGLEVLLDEAASAEAIVQRCTETTYA